MKRGRPRKVTVSTAVSATMTDVRLRAGTQRFYYYAHEMTLGHWWDTADALNAVQLELEHAAGDIPVELVSQWTQPHAGAAGPMIVLRSFFKIGPIPRRIEPARETTTVAATVEPAHPQTPVR